MSLLTAKGMLLKERMDWHKPHLSWVLNNYCRTYRRRGRY